MSVVTPLSLTKESKTIPEAWKEYTESPEKQLQLHKKTQSCASVR